MKGISVALLSAALIGSVAEAATPEQALASRFRAVTAIIDAQLALQAVPGAAIGVVHNQDLIWSHQFGVEDLETATPVSNDTLFSICSISKLFNGVAAMSLVDEGRLSLDAPLSSYLDGAAPLDNTGAEEPITPRNILSHVSGLPREGYLDYWGANAFPDKKELREGIVKQEQLYQPFDYYQYSNVGMSLLGDAIASVSGMPWGDYVDQTIFTPLGMERSVTDMPFDQVGDGFARGYYVRSATGKRKPVEEHSFQAFAPAAGIASSINDMARFMSWHFRLRENGGEEVLKVSTLKQMQRVHWIGAEMDESAYGLAYAAYQYGDEVLWGHDGFCPGTRADMAMRLPTRIGVTMMLTANDVSPGTMVRNVYGLTAGAIEAVYGEDASPAADDAGDEPELAEFEGYYYVENYADDFYVGLDEDDLFAVGVYSTNPANSLETWVHEEGDRFRRQRANGTLADPIDFERDDDGRVVSVMQSGYRYMKRAASR